MEPAPLIPVFVLPWRTHFSRPPDEVPPEDLIQHFELAVQWMGTGRGYITRPLLGVRMLSPAGPFPDDEG